MTGAAEPEGGGGVAEGGEERGKELERAGVPGSQRESRSGLLRRGTGVMSAVMSASGHAPRTPEEGQRTLTDFTEIRLSQSQRHRGEALTQRGRRGGAACGKGGMRERWKAEKIQRISRDSETHQRRMCSLPQTPGGAVVAELELGSGRK